MKKLLWFLVILLWTLGTGWAQEEAPWEEDFVLKGDISSGSDLAKELTSIRLSAPVPLAPLPDSIRFDPLRSVGVGIYMGRFVQVTEQFALSLAGFAWFHKVGYRPNKARLFPTPDTLGIFNDKLRAFTLGIDVGIYIVVARNSKGKPALIIQPGFEAGYVIAQTLKRKFSYDAGGKTFRVKEKVQGLNIFHPYRYGPYLLIGHKDIGLRIAYRFTPWFVPGKYRVNSTPYIPVADDNGTHMLPPVSPLEIGLYLGLQ